MLAVQVSTPSPDPSFPTLVALSRNASVISTSSSDSSPAPLVRPRPMRNFNSPRSHSPLQPSPVATRPPSYLAKELCDNEGSAESIEARVAAARARSRVRSKSRTQSVNTRVSARDFDFKETLGEGSYSTVMRAKYLATNKDYAIKILDKAHLRRHGKLNTVLAEKQALVKLGAGQSHPGIIRLYWAFQDEWSLHFVLDLATNGEMQSRISQLGSLSTQCTQYYTAQIADALDYMHSVGVIHRDLKPENLLLDDAFRIKVTDFGTAKCLDSEDAPAEVFVGTAQYVAPELLEASETSKSSDLWAFGCVIYQMIAGRFAFQGLSEYLTWQKIKKLEYSFPEGFDEDAKDLVQKLLVRVPNQRLGAGAPHDAHSMQALRAHPFLASINWKTLWTDPAPPLQPGLVRKEPAVRQAQARHADIGALWDSLVEGEQDKEDDGLSWAPDAEAPPYFFGRRAGYKARLPEAGSEEGPTDEGPQYTSSLSTRPEEEDTATIVGLSCREEGPPQSPSSNGTGSTSSSSDNSLDDGLGKLRIDRGRDRTPTPVQGNFQLDDVDLTSIQLPGETVVFTSRVEARSLTGSAGGLLSRSGSSANPTPRQLMLTSHRVLCFKRKGQSPVVKTEFLLAPAPEKGKDRSFITGAQIKTEREFVLSTSTKSHFFIAEDPFAALTWVRKITEALQKH